MEGNTNELSVSYPSLVVCWLRIMTYRFLSFLLFVKSQEPILDFSSLNQWPEFEYDDRLLSFSPDPEFPLIE